MHDEIRMQVLQPEENLLVNNRKAGEGQGGQEGCLAHGREKKKERMGRIETLREGEKDLKRVLAGYELGERSAVDEVAEGAARTVLEEELVACLG